MADSTRPAPQPPITDSPWFWVMLFSLFGIAAVATIGPKFEQREQGLETNFHGHERAAGREAAPQVPDDAPGELPHWEPIFTVYPIVAVLGITAVVSMIAMVRLHKRRFSELHAVPPAKPQAAQTPEP
ncbi:MAG TPA: hypothetical protein VGJ15_01605 [Pirellulales bacterium]